MRRRLLLRLTTALPFAGAAMPAAASDTILTVAGRVPAGPHDFSLETLEALGLEQIVTMTPWTQTEHSFSGVKLGRLLLALGLRDARTMRAEALNRYATALLPEDAWQNDALLATRIDGVPMRVRDRGPIWIVFPWSSRPQLSLPEVHERAIWQLRRIEVG
jgi:hypothetical protein